MIPHYLFPVQFASGAVGTLKTSLQLGPSGITTNSRDTIFPLLSLLIFWKIMMGHTDEKRRLLLVQDWFIDNVIELIQTVGPHMLLNYIKEKG